jgi:Flp pilus assembly pilin Flp
VPAIRSLSRRHRTVAVLLLRLACRVHAAAVRSREEGVSMAEYILLTAAVLIIALAAINGFFTAIAGAFQRLAQRLNGVG